MSDGTPERIGDYAVKRELGRGGMGVVYEAVHSVLGRRAIKLLLSEVSRDDALVQRFMNEARAAAAIDHPSIVRVFDVGQSDGHTFIVMELLDGESLANRLRTHGAMAIPTAVELARQCALALGAAHAAGIVHRDLKPDNVFLVPGDDGEQVKLLDFGVAKLVRDGSAAIAHTMTGAILGTPHYMSPEQCEGAREVDARSDLYSLGCMVFQMITGKLPFRSGGVGGLIGMHLHVAPPTLRSLRADAPPELDRIVARLLAKSPDERYQTGADVADALAKVPPPDFTNAPTLVAERADVVDANQATVATQAPRSTRAERSPHRLRRWLPITGVAIAACIAIALVAGRTRESPAEPPPVLAAIPDATPLSELPPKTPEIEVAQLAPVKGADDVKPVDPDLAAAREALAKGDLDHADELATLLAKTASADRDVRELARDIRIAHAKAELAAMEVAVAKGPIENLKPAWDRVVHFTREGDSLRAQGERLWTANKAHAITVAEEPIKKLVRAGRCDEARRAVVAAHDVYGERFDGLLTGCRTLDRSRERVDDLISQILKTTIDNPATLMNCYAVLSLDPARVPFETCVRAACKRGPKEAEAFITPADPLYQSALRKICRGPVAE